MKSMGCALPFGSAIRSRTPIAVLVVMISTVVVGLLATSPESARAQCGLLGVWSLEVDFGDPAEGLIRIDPASGTGQEIGRLDSVMIPFGLGAVGEDLYTYDQIADVLRQLDPETGETLEIIDVGIRETGEGALAMRSDGVGYLSGRETLYRFDLATQASEVVGPLPRMDGLAYGQDGLLYGLRERTYDLYTIDPRTATATLVGPTGINFGGFNFTGGLAFGPDGSLFGANDTSLFAVDTVTGQAQRIGDTGFHDMQGLAYVNCAGSTPLEPGDADQNLLFDNADLTQVLIAGKYLTGQPATWGEGDWDGAPATGFGPGNPPPGNGLFDQQDVVAALQSGTYLTGPYGAMASEDLPGPLGNVSVPVPEPTGWVLALIALWAIVAVRLQRGNLRP